jgi:hypothetical protein
MTFSAAPTKLISSPLRIFMVFDIECFQKFQEQK